MGGSGVWEDARPADHDRASEALPELFPAAIVHLQSSGPVSSMRASSLLLTAAPSFLALLF